MLLKKELRKEMLARRQALSVQEAEMRSELICKHFFNEFQENDVKTVHVFLPIKTKHEIDTWLLIHRFWKDYPHIQIAVPVTDFENGALKHVLLRPDSELRENHWGITEPVNSPQVPENEIDLVLVPLLAIDMQGHRVGYGKGFYDRFLAKCKKNVQKTGLSLEEPVSKIADVHDGDICLDAVVTPNGYLKF